MPVLHKQYPVNIVVRVEEETREKYKKYCILHYKNMSDDLRQYIYGVIKDE